MMACFNVSFRFLFHSYLISPLTFTSRSCCEVLLICFVAISLCVFYLFMTFISFKKYYFKAFAVLYRWSCSCFLPWKCQNRMLFYFLFISIATVTHCDSAKVIHIKSGKWDPCSKYNIHSGLFPGMKH